MRYELFDFQKRAVNELLRKMDEMQGNYEKYGSLSAVALTAPTGAGKTVISAAVAEGLFYGNDTYPGDSRAAILWLSDSPSLNVQTLKRFDAATDLLNGATAMETIGPEFARSHRRLAPGHVYFLNRQLLGKGKRLSNEAEGGRSFYDVLNDTIEDDDIHLFLFIDEAHRGLGTGDDRGTSDEANRTIYSIIIDGQEGINRPMPCVVGISATPERFNNAMKGRHNRDKKAGVKVSAADVRDSGLIKDTIELTVPKKSTEFKDQELSLACRRLQRASGLWKKYCTDNDIAPAVVPLMVIQVEDKVSNDTIADICAQIRREMPDLDINSCCANVFGEHEDIHTHVCVIPYIGPDEVSSHAEVRILFAKNAVSTGWDCPRAEVIYSRRRHKDQTYIAQLIGRMIRTPLARHIESLDELNSVACYLPEFDEGTVLAVIERLKDENIPVDPDWVIPDPIDVKFGGGWQSSVNSGPGPGGITEAGAEGSAEEAGNRSDEMERPDEVKPVAHGTVGVNDTAPCPAPEDADGPVSGHDMDDMPTGDGSNERPTSMGSPTDVSLEEIKESFTGIITRQVRHDKGNPFIDLWTCMDIIMQDIDPGAELDKELFDEFYHVVDYETRVQHQPFKRSLNDIMHTTVAVKLIDPLTGDQYEDREESVESDRRRLTTYWNKADKVFASTDVVKYYINRRISEGDTEAQAVGNIGAAGDCLEIVQAIEQWAEEKTAYLLDLYAPRRFCVTDINQSKWDRIEGNAKPYIERHLSILSTATKQCGNLTRYSKHVIADQDGWAYLNLNGLEQKIVNTELSKPSTVAWYRNQARNLRASLSIPYEMNGSWENMYPDFIFFVKTPKGIARAIVDPHGDWLGDSVAKLRGYIAYLKDHPDMFVMVLVVADEGDGKCRYLDLMKANVRDAIEKFSGSSAKELFTGQLSREYRVTDRGRS